MIYKTYGKTGHQVSAVGFGGMQFDVKTSQDENAQLLRYAHDKGINFFDTAPQYCDDQSEEIFGRALSELSSVRDKIYVCTKGMPETHDTAAKAEEAVKKSLKRLQTDYVDFYYVWCVRKMSQYDLAMQPGGQYEGLLRCQEQGLIKHIAVSSHLRGEAIGTILEKDKMAGALLGMNILNFPYRWAAAEAAHRLGYGVVAMNPLAGGLIPRHEQQLSWLARAGETATEAALRFCIACPQITVALNGFTTREHIDMACRIADRAEPFSPADIERLRQQVNQGLNALCTGCGYCLSHCPKAIPIAGYMQYYNLKPLFGSTDEQMIKGLADQHEWLLLAEGNAAAGDCIQCRACEEACTQHLNIVERLGELARWEAADAAQRAADAKATP